MLICNSLFKRWSLFLQPWTWVRPITALNNRTQQRWGCVSPGWPSIFCFLLLASQLPCKSVPTLGKPQREKPKFKQRCWRMRCHVDTERGRGPTRQRRASEEVSPGVDSGSPGTTLLDATWIRNKPPSWALPEFLTHKTVDKIKWLFQVTKFWDGLLQSSWTLFQDLHLTDDEMEIKWLCRYQMDIKY